MRVRMSRSPAYSPRWLLYAGLLVCILHLVASETEANSDNRKEVNRKSIVFDTSTPKVFYCQQEKQSDFSKMIVKAKPLERLCEFGGKTKPKTAPSDCYNDVDETEYACEEKKRFLLRLDPPSESVDQMGSTTDSNVENVEFLVAKDGVRKKSASGKKF